MHGNEGIYIENADFVWLGGRFRNLSSFTGSEIVKGVDFYGDNLLLESVLKYVGLKAVSSDALISGKVKLEASDNGILIKNSNLYTRPGLGGRLRMPGIGSYLGKQEKGYNQFVSAVMQRFNYDWIRLHADMGKESTKILLESYGKPARKVPYVWDKVGERFIRTTDDNMGISSKLTLKTDFVLPTCFKNKE
ncbi:MAG: hypothetical protein GY750_18505 [Lentisphaerae bacterium]|nr:hypothetical protein [Lentisphaerota bacterium]MCP4103390.1 hypothetical protein [Lentisphaerota bacterium]